MAKVLIETAGTEFEQNMADLAMIDDSFREGRPTMINSADLDEAFTNASQDVKDKISFDVNGEERTVTPTTSQQILTPSKGKNAMTKVTVEATPLESKSVTPSTTDVTVSPTGTGKIGLSSVTVEAVTSAIDSNITAENIKKDVSILGVTGTLSSGPEIIPVEYDHGATLYKTIYLKKENFTIPYSEELVAEISNAFEAAEGGDNLYSHIVHGGGTHESNISLSFESDSTHLCLIITASQGVTSINIMKYTFEVNGETISVTCNNPSDISAFADHTNGLYYDDESDGYPEIAKHVLYSTTADVITPQVGE